jgi:hypothetical protein
LYIRSQPPIQKPFDKRIGVQVKLVLIFIISKYISARKLFMILRNINVTI